MVFILICFLKLALLILLFLIITQQDESMNFLGSVFDKAKQIADDVKEAEDVISDVEQGAKQIGNIANDISGVTGIGTSLFDNGLSSISGDLSNVGGLIGDASEVLSDAEQGQTVVKGIAGFFGKGKEITSAIGNIGSAVQSGQGLLSGLGSVGSALQTGQKAIQSIGSISSGIGGVLGGIGKIGSTIQNAKQIEEDVQKAVQVGKDVADILQNGLNLQDGLKLAKDILPTKAMMKGVANFASSLFKKSSQTQKGNTQQPHQKSKINPQIMQIPIKCQQKILFNHTVLFEEHPYWRKAEAQLCIHHFHIDKKIVPYKNMHKIKVFPDQVSPSIHKMKISHSQKVIFFAASHQNNLKDVPQQFFWFSKIIDAKLMSLSINTDIVHKSDEKNTFVQSTYVGGTIWKKSRFIGNWQKRYTIITPQGIFSYKNPHKPFTYSIQANTITGIWTRFELHEKNLIIKLRHGANQKTQFAIPLTKYSKDTRYNWLYQFYRAMMHNRGKTQIIKDTVTKVNVVKQEPTKQVITVKKQQTVVIQKPKKQEVIIKKEEIITKTNVPEMDLLDMAMDVQVKKTQVIQVINTGSTNKVETCMDLI